MSTRSALHWISQKTKWLMVFDGADGHYSLVEKFLPPGNGGSIIITSRNPGLKRIAKKNSMEVVDMTVEEAVSLLLESAMLDSPSDHILGKARKLVSELGGIPLALDQAGAYMQSCGCSIDQYLELYSRAKDQLMTSTEFRGASDYGANTYGTWDISMKKIDDMAKGTGREAMAAQTSIKLLKIFAFLDHANIPEELFKNAAENFVRRNVDEEGKNDLPLSVRLLDHQILFLNEDGGWEKTRFLAGIQILLSFSFIKPHDQLYSMHLLVHGWSRNKMQKEATMDEYYRARALLCCSIVIDDYGNHEYYRLLAPHIKSNCLQASELGLKDTYYDDEHKFFAFVFDHVGDWHEAEKQLLVAVKWRNAHLGSNHPDTFISMDSLANIYWKQGRWDEAEKLVMDVLIAKKSKLGLDHPDTLESMGNLACTYRAQGRLEEAEKMEVDVIDAMQKRLGSDHPDTLTMMTNLACTYSDQGRWNEAEKLEVEVVNARKVKLGSDHPDTLLSMANLAMTYRNQQRWDEAEKLNMNVKNEMQRKHGSDHPDTLTVMSNLACTYRDQGRLCEAEELDVNVTNVRKAKLGLDHPDTLMSMANLAITYFKQGRLDEAEPLLATAVKKIQKVMGSQHPTTRNFDYSLDLVSKAKQQRQSQEISTLASHSHLYLHWISSFFCLAFQS